jgi:protease-4
LQWAKIDYETLKSGKFKDMASPDRPLTEEEREILENILQEIHLQFKQDVAEERQLREDELEKVADGRIFTGEQAFELKLVDQLGGLQTAIEVAGGLAGIEGEPEVVEKYKKRGHWMQRFIESSVTNFKELLLQSKQENRQALFVY